MYINAGENRRAKLRNAPSFGAKVVATVPHGAFVQAEHVHYLWRRIAWHNADGYMPAWLLCAYDPSPVRWQQRYGAKFDSVFLCTSTSEQVIRFKMDLNFFVLRNHRLDATDRFDKVTEDAVVKFQLIYRLQMDGIAGPETKAALMTGLANRYR